MIAESCSAAARSIELDIAMSRPSDDTATASVTPLVVSTKLVSNQLKSCTSWLNMPVTSPPSSFGPASARARSAASRNAAK